MSELAQANGYRLSNYSATVYTNGSHPATADPATLAALAFVLRLPLDEVRRLAGLPSDLGEFEPDESANLLTRPQRAAVNEIIRQFAEANTRAGDGSGNATPMNQAGGKPASKTGPTANELDELRRRQREADETPIGEILGLAADTGESEAERRARREDSPE